MVSHNKARKSYAVTAEQYSGFYDRIQEEIDIEDMTKEVVRKKIGATPRFPNRQRLAEEFFIARSIALGKKYAKKLGVELNESTTANVETWKDKGSRIVIRESGKFKTWRRL